MREMSLSHVVWNPVHWPLGLPNHGQGNLTYAADVVKGHCQTSVLWLPLKASLSTGYSMLWTAHYQQCLTTAFDDNANIPDLHAKITCCDSMSAVEMCLACSAGSDSLEWHGNWSICKGGWGTHARTGSCQVLLSH